MTLVHPPKQTKEEALPQVKRMIRHYCLVWLKEVKGIDIRRGGEHGIHDSTHEIPDLVSDTGTSFDLAYNGHVRAMPLNIDRELRGMATWEITDEIRSRVFNTLGTLDKLPKGYLAWDAVVRWQKIPELMKEERWKDAWLLARDAMVELAELVCVAYDQNPDQLTEWEKEARIGRVCTCKICHRCGDLDYDTDGRLVLK